MKPSLSQMSFQLEFVTRLPGPRMRKLVRDERGQALVADDHSRRRERQARVLHAAERKARGQHEDVVAAPAIVAVELLGRYDRLLRCLRIPSRPSRPSRVRHRRRCADLVLFAAMSPTAIASRYDGIGLSHLEMEVAGAGHRIETVVRAHHGAQFLRARARRRDR